VIYFLANFFMNAVNISQPIMVGEFNGMALFSWLIALPALGSAVATLMFGKLSDMYGRRSILLVSLGLFLDRRSLSAISTSMTFAIAARVILALGQGALAPLCFSVIGDLFEPAARAKWSGMLNVARRYRRDHRPTMGGLLTDSSLGWRGLFWIMVPLVLIPGSGGSRYPGRKAKSGAKSGFPGDCLDGHRLCSLIIGVSWLGDPDRLVSASVWL
jgi:MFS family permease